MKQLFNYLPLALFAAYVAAPHVVYSVGSADGTISVQIAAKIKITSLQPISFGNIAPVSGKSGKVTISPQNIRSTSGVVGFKSGAYHPAIFKLQGTPGSSYVLNIPTSQFFKRLPDGNNSASSSAVNILRVDKFVAYRATSGKYGEVGRIGLGGQETVHLGGTLNVPANAAAGIYSAAIPVTVSY